MRVAVLATTGTGVFRGSLVETAGEVERTALEPSLRGVVPLHPDDRTNAVLCGLLKKVIGAEHIAVIGHGNGWHSQIDGTLHEVIESSRTIQHGELSVHMQVHEGWAGIHLVMLLRTAVHRPA